MKKKFIHIKMVLVKELYLLFIKNVLFYVYLISKWEGIMPNYTVEEDKKFADLAY